MKPATEVLPNTVDLTITLRFARDFAAVVESLAIKHRKSVPEFVADLVQMGVTLYVECGSLELTNEGEHAANTLLLEPDVSLFPEMQRHI